jgi:hypothetical protein
MHTSNVAISGGARHLSSARLPAPQLIGWAAPALANKNYQMRAMLSISPPRG